MQHAGRNMMTMLEIAHETDIFFKNLNMKLIIILIRNHLEIWMQEKQVSTSWAMGNLFLNVMHMCDVLPCVLSFSVRGEGASNGVLHIQGVDQLFYLTKQKKLKITKKFNFPTQKKPCKFEVNITRNMCVNRKFPLSRVHLMHKTLHRYTHVKQAGYFCPLSATQNEISDQKVSKIDANRQFPIHCNLRPFTKFTRHYQVIRLK